MKRFFILFLLMTSILSSCAALKVFEKKEPVVFNIAKVLTEESIKKIFKLESFSFETSGSVSLETNIQTANLKDILKEKIFNKITSNCVGQVETDNIHTLISFKLINDYYLVKLIRIKKNIESGFMPKILYKQCFALRPRRPSLFLTSNFIKYEFKPIINHYYSDVSGFFGRLQV